MRIYYQLINERKNEDTISKSLNLINMFDKAYFIEKQHLSMKIGELKTLKIDEENKDYPNFLKTDLPRIIIQDIDKKISFSEYLKKFTELTLEKKNNEYFLTIKKQNDTIDLNLKIDKDKTIDLKWISENKNKKDNIYHGIKTYYYVKKE